MTNPGAADPKSKQTILDYRMAGGIGLNCAKQNARKSEEKGRSFPLFLSLKLLL
jgi:trehalose/maltose hydrolase-like predicted phosphorylase